MKMTIARIAEAEIQTAIIVIHAMMISDGIMYPACRRDDRIAGINIYE
jgi:hypothetical protein